MEVIFDKTLDPDQLNQKILDIPENIWIDNYVKLIEEHKNVLNTLGSKYEHIFVYVLAGLYESAIISSYKISDYTNQLLNNKYYGDISW